MTFRGFLSLDINANPEIVEFMNNLEKTGAPLNMVEKNQLHITMKFLGDTEEDMTDEITERVREVLKDFEPFDINVKGTGAFPHLGYMKVLWLGIEEEEKVGKLAHRIEEEMVPLGFDRFDDEEFSPHITVARVKGGKNKERLQDVLENYEDYHFGSQRVRSIKLKESILKKSGAEYEILDEMYIRS